MLVWVKLPHNFTVVEDGSVEYTGNTPAITHLHVGNGIVWADLGYDCRPATSDDFLYYYMKQHVVVAGGEVENHTKEMTFQDVVEDFTH